MYYKKFTLSNFPRKIMDQDYFDACDFIIKKYKNDVRVKSIYLGGGNWVPGISDLDIYIVLDNSFHGRLNIDSNKRSLLIMISL